MEWVPSALSSVPPSVGGSTIRASIRPVHRLILSPGYGWQEAGDTRFEPPVFKGTKGNVLVTGLVPSPRMVPTSQN